MNTAELCGLARSHLHSPDPSFVSLLVLNSAKFCFAIWVTPREGGKGKMGHLCLVDHGDKTWRTQQIYLIE